MENETAKYGEITIKCHFDGSGRPYRFVFKGELFDCGKMNEANVERFLRSVCDKPKIDPLKESNE